MRLELLPAREREQSAHQLAALLGRALGHAEHLALFVAERGSPLDQAEAADHRGEQIVEIVRDAAGQLADRIHLLRLDQLAFERPLFADVGQRSGELDRIAVEILEQHGLVEEMLVVPVAALPAIFNGRAAGLPPCLDCGKYAVAVVGVEPLGPDFAGRANSSWVKPVIASSHR